MRQVRAMRRKIVELEQLTLEQVTLQEERGGAILKEAICLATGVLRVTVRHDVLTHVSLF